MTAHFLTTKGDVIPELIQFLVQEYDASSIRAAIVHMQGKGQQKVIAFLANSCIQQQIPCAIKDHQGIARILQYKQPDVFTDPQMSNVHVKEMRADHHIISQTKGINQRARISAFIPFPRNELSRRRFNRVRSINVNVNRKDILCTFLMRPSLFVLSIMSWQYKMLPVFLSSYSANSQYSIITLSFYPAPFIAPSN